MEAEDLMIWDWVKFPIGNEKIIDLPYIMGKGICASFAASATLFPVEVEKLEPIPLTPEILEKNGFVNVYRGRYRFDDDKGSIVEVSTINNEIKWVRVSKYDENIEEQFSNCTFNDMHFVHELQHALKLCKIDKNIEL